MTSKTTNRGGFSVIRGIAILAIVLIGLPFAAIHFATGSSRPSGKDRYLSTPAPQPSGSEALVRFRVRAKLRSVHDTVQGHALWTVGPESHGPQDFLPGEESCGANCGFSETASPTTTSANQDEAPTTALATRKGQCPNGPAPRPCHRPTP
jgi:hypothetical protein